MHAVEKKAILSMLLSVHMPVFYFWYGSIDYGFLLELQSLSQIAQVARSYALLLCDVPLKYCILGQANFSLVFTHVAMHQF